MTVKVGWTALVCALLIAILLILVKIGSTDIEALDSLRRRVSERSTHTHSG